MVNGYERIGEPVAESEVSISLEDAQRLRSIGRNVILSSESTVHLDETTITASLVVANHLRMPHLLDDTPSIYGFVEDDSYDGNSWRTRLKYHSYGVRDGGLMGFESEYSVDVMDDEVMFAKRSIYRLRDLKTISVKGSAINVEVTPRRTMADTTLESRHIDLIERRMNRLVSRAERS